MSEDVSQAYKNWLKLRNNVSEWRRIVQLWNSSKRRPREMSIYNACTCTFSSLWQSHPWYEIDEAHQIFCYFNCLCIETPLIKQSAIWLWFVFCVERKCIVRTDENEYFLYLSRDSYFVPNSIHFCVVHNSHYIHWCYNQCIIIVIGKVGGCVGMKQ